jgi:hypothetical protein
VELLQELRWLLIVVAAVSLYFPLNVPLAALAFKVQRGTKPLGMESSSLWFRSTVAALGMTLMSWGAIFLDYYLVRVQDLPADVVHLTVLAFLVPAGMWYFFLIFGLDEALDAVSIFLIYLGLPGVVLTLLLVMNVRLPFVIPEGWVLPSVT